MNVSHASLQRMHSTAYSMVETATLLLARVQEAAPEDKTLVGRATIAVAALQALADDLHADLLERLS